jgi:hypothetical protein
MTCGRPPRVSDGRADPEQDTLLSVEVALRKRSAGAGFEVPLERQGTVCVANLMATTIRHGLYFRVWAHSPALWDCSRAVRLEVTPV